MTKPRGNVEKNQTILICPVDRPFILFSELPSGKQPAYGFSHS